MSLVQKLNQSVESLKTNPDYEVLYHHVLPPVPGIVEKAEAFLGHALHPDIAAFYRECGGYQLIWADVARESEDGDLETQKQAIAQGAKDGGLDVMIKGMFVGDNSLAECESTGNIMIQSLETVFFDDDFNDEVVSYEPEIDDLELEGEEKFRILEYFSNSRHVVLILDGSEDPRVIIGSHGEYDGSVVSTWTAYLEHLAETAGDKRKPRIPGGEDGGDSSGGWDDEDESWDEDDED